MLAQVVSIFGFERRYNGQEIFGRDPRPVYALTPKAGRIAVAKFLLGKKAVEKIDIDKIPPRLEPIPRIPKYGSLYTDSRQDERNRMALVINNSCGLSFLDFGEPGLRRKLAAWKAKTAIGLLGLDKR